ncbi:MAG TPA: hypothetical protein DEH78_26975 [Solibacterales bacterium]|nr:hypothetical protein [Bryobacterales bacterium]
MRSLRIVLVVMVLGAMSVPLAAQPRRRLGRPIPTPIERWQQMSPEERQKALDRLPPERRKMMEERLREYRQLSEDEQARLSSQYEEFRKLPPRRQREMRRLFQEFRELPMERRRVVRRELEQLRGLAPGERKSRLASGEFRERFSESERRLIEGMAAGGARE